MKRKYYNTLFALVLLVVVALTIWYQEKRKSKEPAKTETASQKIFSLDASHVKSFTLKPRDGEAITCTLNDGKWAITAPRDVPADQSAITSLVNSATTATVDEEVEKSPKNLKDFGLDPPAFTLEFTTDNKTGPQSLLMGDDTPTSNGFYAQASSNPRVVTLASYLKSSLEKNLLDLRDRRVQTLDVDQLQKIEVTSKGKSFTVLKNPEGFWDLQLPPAVRADSMTVQGMVDSLRSQTMQTIVTEDKKKIGEYGFGSPELKLTLTAPNGTQTITLGKKGAAGSNYYAMNSALDPVFTVTDDFLRQFQKDPSSLRAKDLFSFSSFDVKKLDVTTPKGHWVLQKQGEKWKQTVPSTKDETTEKVEAVLNHLRDLSADSFPKDGSLAALGLTKPQYTFQVQFGDKNTIENVVAAKQDGHLYAARSTDPLGCELTKAALDDVEKALGAL
jgi:Domain of unknown function (DUF4340)